MGFPLKLKLVTMNDLEQRNDHYVESSHQNR